MPSFYFYPYLHKKNLLQIYLLIFFNQSVCRQVVCIAFVFKVMLMTCVEHPSRASWEIRQV